MQCTANVIAIGQLCMFFIVISLWLWMFIQQIICQQLGYCTTTTTMKRKWNERPTSETNTLYVCSYSTDLPNPPENQRRYICRGLYEFFIGRSCCLGRDVGIPRQRRWLQLWLRLLFEVSFVFQAMSYTKTMLFTIYQSLVCSLVPKTISSRWVLLMENLQKITNSPALSFTNLLCCCCGFAPHLQLQ